MASMAMPIVIACDASGKKTLLMYPEPINATPEIDAAFEIRMLQFNANASDG